MRLQIQDGKQRLKFVLGTMISNCNREHGKTVMPMSAGGSDGASAYRNSTPVTADVVPTLCMNTNPAEKKLMLK